MQNLQEVPQTPQPLPAGSAENDKAEKSLFETIEKLPWNSNLTLHKQSCKDYENLLEAVGLRISYTEGILQIMTLSTEHKNYVRLLQTQKLRALFGWSSTYQGRYISYV